MNKKGQKLPLVKILCTTAPCPAPLASAIAVDSLRNLLLKGIFSPEWDKPMTVHHTPPLPGNIYQEGTSLTFHSKLDVYHRSKNPVLKATTTHIAIRKARASRERNVSAWIKVHFIARSCFILLLRLETRRRIKYFSKHTFCPQSTKRFWYFIESNFVHQMKSSSDEFKSRFKCYWGEGGGVVFCFNDLS